MSDGEKDFPVAEMAESETVNPFGAPQATSETGTSRPQEETRSANVLISLSLGLIVTAITIIGPLYLLGRLNMATTNLFTWIVLLVLLSGIGLGILTGLFAMRKLSREHQVQ